MGFGDLKTKGGVEALNSFLADKSYLEGYTPSQSDVAVYEALSGAPPAELNNALRWFNQIASYGSGSSSLPGVKKPLDQYGPATTSATAAKADDADDEDFDMFGSDDDEEEAAELEKIKAERVAAYNEKKAQKKTVIAKSIVTLDVKPYDDETDMLEVEKMVRKIEKDGMKWTMSKLVDVAYGIKKLVITAVIEDDKISTDWLEEEILAFEDQVQSVDIASFNKL